VSTPDTVFVLFQRVWDVYSLGHVLGSFGCSMSIVTGRPAGEG
jgi:hypothetical protein